MLHINNLQYINNIIFKTTARTHTHIFINEIQIYFKLFNIL